MSGMLEQIREYARQLVPRGPVPSRLEVGALVHQRLKELASPQSETPLWPSPSAMYGITVVPREDLEPDAWRLLDTDGAEMQSGRLPNNEGDTDASA